MAGSPVSGVVEPLAAGEPAADVAGDVAELAAEVLAATAGDFFDEQPASTTAAAIMPIATARAPVNRLMELPTGNGKSNARTTPR
jgi:hypothetical protein